LWIRSERLLCRTQFSRCYHIMMLYCFFGKFVISLVNKHVPIPKSKIKCWQALCIARMRRKEENHKYYCFSHILKIYYLDIAISFHTFSSERVEETAMEPSTISSFKVVDFKCMLNSFWTISQNKTYYESQCIRTM